MTDVKTTQVGMTAEGIRYARVPYPELADKYYVTETGQVWSVRRKKYLAANLRESYPCVCMAHDNTKATYPIHRLVAMTFIQKPEGCNIVNHKDGNRENNNVANLEWITHKANTEHANNVLKVKRPGVKVNQYSLDGKFIAEFPTIKDAEQATGTKRDDISGTCLGRRESAGNFIWRYVDRKVDPQPEGATFSDYPNYVITPDGRIYSKRVCRFMIPKDTESGYLSVGLSNGTKTDFGIHRLVALAYIPNPENKPYVNHKDGVKTNNDVSNLEWVTPSENMLHAVSTGLLKPKTK